MQQIEENNNELSNLVQEIGGQFKDDNTSTNPDVKQIPREPDSKNDNNNTNNKNVMIERKPSSSQESWND